MQIIKYDTELEANSIIAEKTAQGLKLIEVSNVTEGNFLGFSEESTPPQVNPINERLTNIENTLDLILLKQEGIL